MKDGAGGIVLLKTVT